MLNLHFIPVGSFVGSICKQISLTLRCTADAVHLRTTGPTLPGSGCKRRGFAATHGSCNRITGACRQQRMAARRHWLPMAEMLRRAIEYMRSTRLAAYRPCNRIIDARRQQRMAARRHWLPMAEMLRRAIEYMRSTRLAAHGREWVPRQRRDGARSAKPQRTHIFKSRTNRN